MDISKIVVGTMYKCDDGGAQFFGVAKEIKSGKVSVVLGDKINEDGDRGDPIDRRGDTPVWLAPENIHPISNDLDAEKIYADAGQPATLRYGAKSVACHTLQEAVLACMRLSEQDRAQATIRADDGTVHNANEIDRLHIATGSGQ